MGNLTQEISNAGAVENRRRALENYYTQPNYCKNCGVLILVRPKDQPCDVKKKKFCSKSCSASYNNKGVNRWAKNPSSERVKESHGPCLKCGVDIEFSPLTERLGYYRKKYCDACRPHPSRDRDLLQKGQQTRIRKYGLQDWSNINQMTKQEVLEKSGGHSWTMKCTITRYARKTYRNSGKPQICKACGYTEHINVCHVKDIKDFPMDTLIGEINHIDNLVALCPNHHWEFDHGELEI